MIDYKIPIQVKHTLKDLRVRAGLNQSQASDKLNISIPTLLKWERDSSNLKVSDVSNIAKAYSIPEDYIFFGNNNAFNEKIMIYKKNINKEV